MTEPPGRVGSHPIAMVDEAPTRRASARVAQKRANDAPELSKDAPVSKQAKTQGGRSASDTASKRSENRAGDGKNETKQRKDDDKFKQVHVGDALPAIELQDQDGETVKIGDLRSVVIFVYPRVRPIYPLSH